MDQKNRLRSDRSSDFGFGLRIYFGISELGFRIWFWLRQFRIFHCNLPQLCYAEQRNENATTLRTLLLLICVRLATIFTGLSLAAEVAAPPVAREIPQVQQDLAPNAGLSLASTNSQVLLDAVSRGDKPLVPGGNDKNVAKLVARILVANHYLQQPLDNAVANKFLDRYIEVLDNLHMHFLLSDLTEFDKYRAKLDDQIYKEGDTTPAREIFTRFLQRIHTTDFLKIALQFGANEVLSKPFTPDRLLAVVRRLLPGEDA